MTSAHCVQSVNGLAPVESVVHGSVAARAGYERGGGGTFVERPASALDRAGDRRPCRGTVHRPGVGRRADKNAGYVKFAARPAAFGTSISTLAGQYTAIASTLVPSSVPRVVTGDSDDDHVIAAAVAARADRVVTGDRRHLLPLGSHQGFAIVTAREVIDSLEPLTK